MMKRLLLALALLGLLVGPAHAMRNSVFYEFGFTRSAFGQISTRTDSIPFGTTFKTHWIPCMGAKLVKFNMRATAADSDSVVQVRVANVDTVTGTVVRIDTLSTQPGLLGQGIHVMGDYNGAGGTSWDPANGHGIYVAPYVSTTVIFSYIPQRWVRFTVVAPSRACRSDQTAPACNSMHAVRIWVEVLYDGENTGQDPTYPFQGAAGF